MPEQMEAGLFAVDQETRTVRGLLVPYGETSRPASAAGIKTAPVRFERGDIGIPADPDIVTLNEMHDRFQPRGRAAELADDARGVIAAFRIASTPEGDAWLADARGLVRLSPELRNIRRRSDGSATAELVGAALVDEGAFATAGLFSLDHGDPELIEEPALEDEDPETPDPAPAEEDTEPEEPADQEEDTVPEATVPNTLAGGAAATEQKMGAAGMFRALATIASGRADAGLVQRAQAEWGGGESGLFALSDIDYDGASGVGAAMVQPAWLGEVTDGVEYQPLYADLFEQRDLTSLAMAGWGWVTPPEGGDWTGNKSDIPSNAVDIEPITANAGRWAGGHDHAREHRDFNTPGYFESYWAKMTESFLKWLDGKVISAALAAALPLEADNPAGLDIGSAMSALIDGAAEVVEAGRIPTFGIVSSAGWKQILKTPNSAVLGYLDAALGLDKGTLDSAGFVLRPSGSLGAGVEALVGTRTSGRTYRLPGSPIRAEALDIARGGIDTGAFGYGGWMPVNPDALIKVTTYTP